MKKQSKVIVGILVLFLVMAIGYALFAQTLNINGTASANGNLDLTYECLESVKFGGGDGKCEPSGENQIITTGLFEKPDDGIEHVVKITNTGTIPAKLTGIDSTNNVKIADKTTAGDEMYFDSATFLNAYYGISQTLGADNLPVDPLVGDAAVVAAEITLNPGDTIYVGVRHGWQSDPSQPALPEDGAGITYNLTFNFQQTTVQ